VVSRLRLILLVAGVAASLALSYLAFRDIDFGAFVDALKNGDPAWYVASFAVLAVAYAVRVARWWVLFAPDARPPFRAVVRALFVGDFLTSLLPALRLGEFARVVVLHREAQTSRAVGLGTVVTERLQDVLTLLVLLIVAVPFAPPVSWLRSATVLLAVLVAGVVVLLAVLARFGSRPLRFALRPLHRLPGFSQARTELAAEGLVRGLAGLRDVRMALASFALTALYWLGFALSFSLALRGVGIEFDLDAGILVTVATTFSLLLPSLPASVGIFEAATLIALEPYGVDDARALSGGVVIHVLTFVPFLIVGPLALRGHTVIVRRKRRVRGHPQRRTAL
jgi:glycosyltransferase 2 family protein